jgi:hypothetical protein
LWAVGGTIAVHAALAFWLAVDSGRARRIEPSKSLVKLEIAPKKKSTLSESTGEGGATVQPKESGETRAVAKVRSKKGAPKAALSEGTGIVALEEGTSRGSSSSGSATIAADISLDLPVTVPEIDLVLPQSSGGDGGALAKIQPKAGGEYHYDDTTFEAKINRDGTVEIEDKWIPYPSVGLNEEGELVLEIPLDLTDTIMRLAGEDPYGYEKRKFLAETQELRGQMAEAACQENLDASLLEIRPRLDAIWNDRALSLSAKKKKLFSAWDECAEDGAANVLKTSEMIRASILAFINDHLPPTSTLAYSRSDLAALNEKRTSKAVFDPYLVR